MSSDGDSDLTPGTVVVTGNASGLAQDVTVGRHRLLADEPTAGGGTDTGPNPYDLLLAALGSCTSMTLALYARRKRWPLEAVTVRLRHSKIHAADCAECDTREGLVDHITSTERYHWLGHSTTISARGCWRSRTSAPCTARSSPRSTSRRAWFEVAALTLREPALQDDLLQRREVSEHQLAQPFADARHRLSVPAHVGKGDPRDDRLGQTDR